MVPNLLGQNCTDDWQNWLDNSSIVDIPHNGSILGWAQLKLITGISCTWLQIMQRHVDVPIATLSDTSITRHPAQKVHLHKCRIAYRYGQRPHRHTPRCPPRARERARTRRTSALSIRPSAAVPCLHPCASPHKFGATNLFRSRTWMMSTFF